MLTTRDAALRWGPLALIGAVLVWHSLQYDFVTDDAYISFVYSRNLAEHGELVFNLGDRVEGYTNFLWTFLLGVLMLVGAPPEISSRVLGTGFGLATLVVAFLLVEELLGRRSKWAYLAPALLAMSSGYACWSSGGLETQMFTFWVALGLHAYVRGRSGGAWLRRAGIFFALAAMTRPEGLLIAGLVGLHRLAANGIGERRALPSRDELACLGWFLALWGTWFAWRWWYYGYPFPNTYYVKAAGPIAARDYHARLMSAGWAYLWSWLRQTGLVYVAPLPLIGFFAAPVRSRGFYFGTLAALVALVYAGYTVRVGGDFMGLHRFIMPLFFLAAVGVTLGLARITSAPVLGWARVPDRFRVPVAASLAAALALGFGAKQLALTHESLRWGNWRATSFGVDTPFFLSVYTHDRAAIGKAMAGCFSPDQFSIVGGAGAQPYYARMRGIDVFGLVSEKIAHEVPRTNPRAGHNKWGPDHVLLSYHPDFVFSCYSLHAPGTRPGYNCHAAAWTRRGYERVTMFIPGIRERVHWRQHGDGSLAPTKNWYTFWKKKGLEFDCPGQVPRSQWR